MDIEAPKNPSGEKNTTPELDDINEEDEDGLDELFELAP